MTENTGEIFDDIRSIMQTDMNATERYHALDMLLLRALKHLAHRYPADFSHAAARLHWLCKQTGHPSFPLEIFRSRACLTGKNLLQPDKAQEPYDLKAVCEGLAAFYRTDIPQDIRERLPLRWHGQATTCEDKKQGRHIRITVCHWDDRFIYGKNNTYPTDQLLKVEYTDESDHTFSGLNVQLFEGAQLNLLSVRTVKSETADPDDHPYILKPELLILEPDFLIDITALCACIKPYGNSAYTHLLNKFASSKRSAAIQLGNAANQFLDDCINENAEESTEEQLYLRSMQNSFRLSPLAWSATPDIDREFFERCKTQFRQIRHTIQNRFHTAGIDISQTEVQLEPSFLCEALGLQGRMDLLTRDTRKLVELKSGKAEEYPHRSPRSEHLLQMGLYKEILYYNLNRPHEEVQSFLFYSRYPQLYVTEAPRRLIRQSMALRNSIIYIEHRLKNGESRHLLKELTEERLNTAGLNNTLYTRYLRPRIMEILRPLHGMQGVEADYFHRFLTFMQREQFLAKTGDGREESIGGFAGTWLCDTQTKRQNGNILTDLRLYPLPDADGSILRLQLDIPEYSEDFLPNFRQGDMVMLYERNSELDTVTSKQFFRCTIEEIQAERLWLRLSYKQRNARVFHTNSLYAVEPGYMDAAFGQAYSGLFSFLTAPRERKELLLGMREPSVNLSVRLNGHYPDEDINRIVLKAKQAEDYFLLIGPPGTGKTSVALKAMVEEFLSDSPEKTILLMAYTNRAVDEICHMLSTITPAPEYIRIGQELNCQAEYRPHLMKHVIKDAVSRKEIYERLSPVRLFTGTISSLCNQTELFNLKAIDVAIIDEASQVLEPQMLPLLCAKTTVNKGDYNLNRLAIGKFILIGDHKQLPAVVVQPQDSSKVSEESLHKIGLTDCRNSLFERLHHLNRIQGTEGIVEMLRKQGRMHPAISEFVNRYFYNGRLDIVPMPHQTEPLPFKDRTEDNAWTAFAAHTRIGFISATPYKNEQNTKSNKKEAETVAELVETLIRLHRRDDIPFHPEQQIGIIVPFRAQIAMIRKALADRLIPHASTPTIDTVERYQGSQRDIIIFSTTVSRFYQLATLSEPVITEGQEIDRKLNVALTRARKQFFMTGNDTLLRRCTAYRNFLNFLKDSQVLHI